jgi:biopolymer transport protein TolR
VAISTSSARGGATADINVTPMADVMLVLLIIFMITAPLLATGFVATMPEGVNIIKAPEDADDVTLGIDRDGSYFINTAPVAKANVQARLTALYASRTKDKILYLKADVNLTMETVQEGISMARAAGVRVIAAVTDQRLGTEPTVSTAREGAH